MALVLEIPEEIVSSSRLSLEELRVELAVALYANRRLSIGKAHELASMSLWQFRQLLASRQIEVDLSVDDLEKEIQTLKRLGRL